MFDRKIRILSFQNAHNFGAVLQAFGLQQTLISMGFKDVKFLNYNPKYLRDRYNPLSSFNTKRSFRTIKDFLSFIANYPFFLISSYKRNKAFEGSISRLLIQTDRLISSEKDLENESFDVLICGSDQIWNTSLTGAFDRVFLGYGPYKNRGQIISYAPSTELSSLTDKRTEELAGLLSNFSYISVREIQVKEKLTKYLNRNIEVCVDPTILCGSEAFVKITAPRIIKEDYILVYAYDYRKDIIQRLIKSIPNNEKYRVEIIYLSAKGRKDVANNFIHSEIRIEEFLSYFKYASYIVTNSFHGLAFSLLYRKNFNVAYEEGKHIRCLSLLKQLDLESRFVKIQEPNWDTLAYDNINLKLQELRAQSLNYLKKAIGI